MHLIHIMRNIRAIRKVRQYYDKEAPYDEKRLLDRAWEELALMRYNPNCPRTRTPQPHELDNLVETLWTLDDDYGTHPMVISAVLCSRTKPLRKISPPYHADFAKIQELCENIIAAPKGEAGGCVA